MPTLAWRSDVDGFAFSNSWALDLTERATLAGLAANVVPAAVVAASVVIPDPFTVALLSGVLTSAAQAELVLGPLPAIGLCGGMAYTSLDYWRAQAALPRGAHRADRPARTGGAATMLRDLLWQRLMHSLTFGGVLQRTLEWSLVLNQLPGWLGGGPGRLLRDAVIEWGNLKARIDAGQPCPIGLVYSARPVWDQHQVLVYGYTDPGDGTGQLQIYDSNHPNAYGDASDGVITLNFTGGSLVATSPSDGPGTIAGFFCSDYSYAAPPAMLAARFGQFLRWSDDPRTFMVADGARLPVADPVELAALGATSADVRMPGVALPPPVRPRDGALLRERSAAPVFLYAGGAPFWVPDPIWLQRFGGWAAVRTVPDGTLASLIGPPDEGTLLREWSDPRVFVVEGGQRRWVRTGAGLAERGGGTAIRVLPDGALAVIPEGPALPPVRPSGTVPDLIGMTRPDARQAVLAASFKPAITGPGGRTAVVSRQTPSAGDTAELGSFVQARVNVENVDL